LQTSLCKWKERICALKIPYAFERSGYVHCKRLYVSERSGYVHWKFLMHLRGADMFIANVFYASARSGYVHWKFLMHLRGADMFIANVFFNASARSGYVHWKFLMHLRGADMFIANIFMQVQGADMCIENSLCIWEERICSLQSPYTNEYICPYAKKKHSCLRSAHPYPKDVMWAYLL